MIFKFSVEQYEKIAETLRGELEVQEDYAKITVDNPEEGRFVILEIHAEVPYPDKTGNMLIIHTTTSHMQMHNCLGYIASDMLGEVMFISESAGNLSGVIVEKGAGVTIYTNIDRKLLSADFSTLAPEVMMASIALSLADHLLPE